MKLRLLAEEFVDYFVSRGFHGQKFDYPIYKNPTYDEIKQLWKEAKETKYIESIRFLAIPQKKEVYIFPSLIMHANVAAQFKLPYWNKFSFPGVAVWNNNKRILEVVESVYFEDVADSTERGYLMNKSWKWLEKYSMDIETYFKSFRGKE